MRALILAGGYGSRLGELTKILPKPLIEVGGVSIVDRTISKLIEVGISEITINTHYLSDMVADHLMNKWTSLKLRITFEPKLLGTAGTLKNNIEWLAVDDFVVMHGDNFFADSLFELTKGSIAPGNLLRACTFYSNKPQECGIFTLSSEKRILRFDEKKQNVKSNLANAAIYRFSKEIGGLVNALDTDENDISRNLIPKILNKIELVELKGCFVDIGTEQGLIEANSNF